VVLGVGSGWSAGGLIIACGVEGEVAEQFAGGRVDDVDVEVGDEQDDGGFGLGFARGRCGGAGRCGAG
jgi:hypothetical protein